MEFTIQELIDGLDALQKNERFWFWFCPHLEIGIPALMIAPFRNLDSVSNLESVTASMDYDAGIASGIGFGVRNLDGQIDLAGTFFNQDSLKKLAMWISLHIQSHPSLVQLRNTRILKLSMQGTVEEIYQNEKLWSFVKGFE